MTTAILSALPEEQAGLHAQLRPATLVRHAGREFHAGQWHARPVVLALSRIGKVAAATTATLLIERFGVRRIIFTGVAGGLGPGVRVGDTVVARETLQHDMDASPIFARHEIPLYGRSRFDTDAALSGLLLDTAREVATRAWQRMSPALRVQFGLHEPPGVHHGLLLSGDRFISSASEARALQQELPDALAVDMEAAAVAQVCNDYDVAFAAVRNVSDRADDQAHVDFPAYLSQVAGVQAEALIGALLERLRD